MSDQVRFRNFLRHSASVSHAVLRSNQLTLQEKGLYSILCSYGWSGSAFPGQKRLAEENGVSDRTIRNHIKRLVELGLITVEDRRKQNKTNIYYIEFPDDRIMGNLFPNGYDHITKDPEPETEPQETDFPREGDHRKPISSAHRKPVSYKELSVEELTDIKDIRRKRKKRIYDNDSPYMKMAVYLKEKILSWKPNAKIPNDLNSWADDFRKTVEIDNRTKQEIKDVIDWATSDSFWQANIMSPGKLREKFDTLQAQMNRKVIQMPPREEPAARPNAGAYKKLVFD